MRSDCYDVQGSVLTHTENSWRWKEDCGDGNVRENQLMHDSVGQEPFKIEALYVLRRVDR